MKKILLVAGILLASYNCLLAQQGLENIIVEKYYVSTAADTVDSEHGGYLPIGSVTYRIFADLKPVYRLQAVYGTPEHELRIETSTRFFNCAQFDSKAGNEIEPKFLPDNSLMLDSWVSVGAAALDYQGVLKSADDTVPSLALKNVKGMYKNNSPEMGIPLTERDGMKFLKLQPATNFFNIEKDLRIFEYQYRDSVSGVLSTRDGAWASFGGSVGPQPENRVLIAQLTTDGVLKFEMNMQVAVPGGGVQRFVARNPVDSEMVVPALIYNSSPSNEPPTVKLIAPDVAKLGNHRNLEFNAVVSDADGKVIAVEYYVNNKFVSRSDKAPFLFNYSYDGHPAIVSVTAIDDKGAKTRSSDFRLPSTGTGND